MIRGSRFAGVFLKVINPGRRLPSQLDSVAALGRQQFLVLREQSHVWLRQSGNSGSSVRDLAISRRTSQHLDTAVASGSSSPLSHDSLHRRVYP